MPLDGPWSVPELIPAGAGRTVVRLPELDNVALTAPTVAVIDHPHFQRLRRVRMLGPTHMVYPGATHTRFEHCVGVYGTVIKYLQSLLQRERVRVSLTEEDVRTVLMAGLLHDTGHYPFTLEAVHHRTGSDTPRHEELGRDIVFGVAPGLAPAKRPIAAILEREVGVAPERVMSLVMASRSDLESPVDRFLQSIISSALDADKMDYLWRDSVHLGVPYGRNYDRQRLLNALTLNATDDGLAVESKGVISAEIFLFCRYTMYSEVYWHHTVRSLSAMLELAWADMVQREGPGLHAHDLTSRLLGGSDDDLLRGLAAEAPPGTIAADVLACITQDRRRPYKRAVTWARSYADAEKVKAYAAIYHATPLDHSAMVNRLRHALGALADPTRGRPLPPGALILDVPPRDKDKQPDIPVHHPRGGQGSGAWSMLSDESAVVRGIGEDFMRRVKKIRLFVHPSYADRLLSDRTRLEHVVAEAVLT